MESEIGHNGQYWVKSKQCGVLYLHEGISFTYESIVSSVFRVQEVNIDTFCNEEPESTSRVNDSPDKTQQS